MNSVFPKPESFSAIQCALCKETVFPVTGNQQYCPSCAKASLKKHNQEENTTERRKKFSELLIIAGKQIDALEEKHHRSRLFDSTVSADKKVVIKVPYSSNLSKNKLFNGYRSRGGFFTPKAVKLAKKTIVNALKDSCREISFKEDKIYISLMIVKENNRVDAVNLVDSIMDAIQDGIGINDRWFAIKKLDWEVSRHNPFILIGIEQSSEQKQICRSCNRFLTLDNFTDNSSAKSGKASYCNECYQLARKLEVNKLTI